MVISVLVSCSVASLTPWVEGVAMARRGVQVPDGLDSDQRGQTWDVECW